jgi:hypothetical protein
VSYSRRRLVTLLAMAALLIIASPAAMAGGNHNGGSGKCTQNTPRVSIDNTWAWAAPGSYGLPGQTLMYALDVFNNDTGCSSSSFTVSMSGPPEFSVSIPVSTITLSSASTRYVWAYVTSPSSIADSDYALTATVTRTGSSDSGEPSASWYKVYSTDAQVPSLYWENPWDGATLSGRSYSVGVASSDDHAVKQIDLYIDDVYTSTSVCDDISATCLLSYKWSIRRVHGSHMVTFKSIDWMGNVGVLDATVTVN